METNDNKNNTNNQNALSVWQGLWAKLFWQIIEEMTKKEYINAYQTMYLLKAQLPPECETDTQDAYAKMEKTLNPKIEVFTVTEAAQYTQKHFRQYGFKALAECMTAVKNSLYTRKWITKNFGFSGVDPNDESRNM